MAQFEPRQRPPRPPEQEGEDDFIGDGLDQAEQFSRKLSGRRFLPRFPVPKRLKAAYGALPQEMRYRLGVIGGFAQTAMIVIFVTISAVLIFKAITNATIVEPSNGREVLAPIENPSESVYAVETIRVKEIDGSLLRQDSLRGFEVNPAKRKLLALVSGVDSSSFRMASDGKDWIIQYRDGEPKLIDGLPSRNELRPVYASDLVPVAGEIVTSKETVNGKRGWLITWRPSAAVLLRLLSAQLLDINSQDINAIRRGDFKVRYATATVTHGERMLYQIDTTILVNGAQLRILATYREQDAGRLDELQIRQPEATQVN
jgi:hypothetical protein